MSEPTVRITPELYITERVNQYQNWYNKKSVRTKRRFLSMRGFSVVGGGLVPVLLNIPELPLRGIPIIHITVTVTSLLVVIAVSLESVLHYREQWKNYRSTEQMLGHETYLFRSRVGLYKGLAEDAAFQLFVERVENAIAAENAATLNVMTMASEAAEATKKSQDE
jgi:hypothetical protein